MLRANRYDHVHPHSTTTHHPSPITHHPSPTQQFAIGDRVRFRDHERDEWKKGVVESIQHATGKPVVIGDGQKRPFTWNLVEKDVSSTEVKYAKGDKVQVRDGEKDKWQQGVVESVNSNGQPKVRISGGAMAFSWAFVEKAAGGKTQGQYSVGDKVRVRDRAADEWNKGVVKSAGPKPMVATSRGTFMWSFVEHDTEDSIPALPGKGKESSFGALPAASSSSSSSVSSGTYKQGDKVQVRDNEKDPWKRGVVATAGSKPLVRCEGSDHSFTWSYYRVDTDDSPIPEKFKGGDRVLVRDSNKEDWKEGVVDTAFGSKPTVKLIGQKTGYTWSQVKKFVYTTGDRVKVRDSPREEWKEGIVDTVDGSLIKVRVGQQSAFTWNEIQRF